MGKILLVILISFGMPLIFIGCSDASNSGVGQADVVDGQSVDLNTFVQEFDNDRRGFDQKYKNKYVQIKGFVKSHGYNSKGVVLTADPNLKSSIIIECHSLLNTDPATLAVGQQVIIKGQEDLEHMSMGAYGGVLMKNCSVIK